MPPHLGKKKIILIHNLSNSDIQKDRSAQNPSKKVSTHYNIFPYFLSPKLPIKPLAFYFLFQFRMFFSPTNASKLFNEIQYPFYDPCKR